jgi:shikimate dehydrogenase
MKAEPVKDVYTFADLQDLEKSQRKLKPPIRLGVFGDPIAHSLSPQMQNAALKHCSIDAQFARFQIGRDELQRALELVRRLDFVGLNLTVPHKLAACAMVDEVETDAAEIGAINTIALRDQKLIGFNTDAVGFARAIRSEFSIDLRDLRVLLFGAGGAARAIAVQCARSKCERLAIVNRDHDKAVQLVADLQSSFTGPRVLGPVARLEAVPWEEQALRFQLEHTDLVVNATPIGLKPNDPSILASTVLQPHLMIFDTVYARHVTPLVASAVEAGARAANGLSMLLHQGARAFEIWFGREAPLDVMRGALR